MCLFLDSSSMIREVESSRGLRSGDGVAWMEASGHAVELDVHSCKEWDQLFKCKSCWGCTDLSTLASAARTWFLVAGSTCTYLQRCGTMFCFSFPAIGGQSICTDEFLLPKHFHWFMEHTLCIKLFGYSAMWHKGHWNCKNVGILNQLCYKAIHLSKSAPMPSGSWLREKRGNAGWYSNINTDIFDVHDL